MPLINARHTYHFIIKITRVNICLPECELSMLRRFVVNLTAMPIVDTLLNYGSCRSCEDSLSAPLANAMRRAFFFKPHKPSQRKNPMNFNDYIKTYADLSEQVGPMVLANEIARRPLELINGDPKTEIFQFYIIQNPEFLLQHTDELVFRDDELGLYVWGIDHFGTPWSSVPVPTLH